MMPVDSVISPGVEEVAGASEEPGSSNAGSMRSRIANFIQVVHSRRGDLQVNGVVGEGDDGRLQPGRGVDAIADPAGSRAGRRGLHGLR